MSAVALKIRPSPFEILQCQTSSASLGGWGGVGEGLGFGVASLFGAGVRVGGDEQFAKIRLAGKTKVKTHLRDLLLN